jgi:hypothetical protein
LNHTEYVWDKDYTYYNDVLLIHPKVFDYLANSVDLTDDIMPFLDRFITDKEPRLDWYKIEKYLHPQINLLVIVAERLQQLNEGEINWYIQNIVSGVESATELDFSKVFISILGIDTFLHYIENIEPVEHIWWVLDLLNWMGAVVGVDAIATSSQTVNMNYNGLACLSLIWKNPFDSLTMTINE